MDNKSTLTPEQLSKIKNEVIGSMSNIRHSLLLDFPFTAAIAMRLNLKPIRDKRCRTACVDGKTLYFDCDFYSKLTDQERKFVMAHEVWHCVMLHLSRCQTRDRNLFNIASDMEVNNLLVDHSQGINMEAPEGLLFPPPNMKGKSAEVIYDWLLKQAKKNPKNGGSGGMSMPSDSAFGSQDNSKDEKDDNGSEDGNGKPGSSKGKKTKGKGNLSGQFDKHKYTEDPDEQKSENDPNSEDQWGEVGYDPDFNPSVSADIAERMREAVTAAAQQAQRTAGGLPGAITSLLDKIMKPEVNWREELSNFVTMVYGDGRTWLPPNRRHVYNDTYFQSRRDMMLKVAVAVDTSGSCVGDLPKFFGELNGLLNSFGKYELTLIQNDYAISRVDTFDQDNPFDPDGFEWKGGGGTSFKPPFEWIKEHNPDIDCMCYLTDGYEGFFDDESCINTSYPEPPYPVIWVLTKDGNRDFCPWGKKIYFKESAYSY